MQTVFDKMLVMMWQAEMQVGGNIIQPPMPPTPIMGEDIFFILVDLCLPTTCSKVLDVSFDIDLLMFCCTYISTLSLLAFMSIRTHSHRRTTHTLSTLSLCRSSGSHQWPSVCPSQKMTAVKPKGAAAVKWRLQQFKMRNDKRAQGEGWKDR